MNSVKNYMIDPIFTCNTQLNAQWESTLLNWRSLRIYRNTLNDFWVILPMDLLYDE